jgi:hypothetical protein
MTTVLWGLCDLCGDGGQQRNEACAASRSATTRDGHYVPSHGIVACKGHRAASRSVGASDGHRVASFGIVACDGHHFSSYDVVTTLALGS